MEPEPIDINITLIEFAVASSCRPVCTPDRLYLIALEKLWQIISTVGDHACERNGQIVPKARSAREFSETAGSICRTLQLFAKFFAAF